MCYVQRSLTKDALRSFVQAFIRCRLDYCNALLTRITDTQIKRLQPVQNTAARLVSGARRRNHITPVLGSLHWLPVKDHSQDCGPRMEMHPRRRTTISARILRAGGESSRTSSTAVGINWMCRPAKSTDVGGPAQLRLPRANSVEQFAISTA